MSEHKTLYVVRGAQNFVDPTYACASHDNKCGKYAMLEIDNEKGMVTKRMLVTTQGEVEQQALNYRGVIMDSRTDDFLLPKPNVEGSTVADLDDIRRAKSDTELQELRELSQKTREMLNTHDEESTFRSVADELGNRSYFKAYKTEGFTEYRGGMKNEKGICSDLTRVVPNNEAWKERLQRTNQGLDLVTKSAEEGVSVEELNNIFRGCLDETKDMFVPSCVHSTGYESNESLNKFEKLKAYDFITVGVAISDGKDTALVYRGTKQILPAETSSSVTENKSENEVHNESNPFAFRGNAQFPFTMSTPRMDGMSLLANAFS